MAIGWQSDPKIRQTGNIRDFLQQYQYNTFESSYVTVLLCQQYFDQNKTVLFGTPES